MLGQLRAELGITGWALHRRLAAEGFTFRNLLLKVKLEEARRLLEATSLSVGEVSERLGFDQQSSFTRFFRSEVGVAPRRCRAVRCQAMSEAPGPASREAMRSGAPVLEVVGRCP